MLRRFACALFVLSLAACSDEDSVGNSTNGSSSADSGARDAAASTSQDGGVGLDAAVYVPTPDKATSTGETCETAAECKGSAPTCLTTLSAPSTGVGAGAVVSFPDGYCSASCKADVECGAGAGCPVGESLSLLPPAFANVLSGLAAVASNCYQECETQSDCRDGYTCETFADVLSNSASAAGPDAGAGSLTGALGSLLGGPISTKPYCLPAGSVPTFADAGSP